MSEQSNTPEFAVRDLSVLRSFKVLATIVAWSSVVFIAASGLISVLQLAGLIPEQNQSALGSIATLPLAFMAALWLFRTTWALEALINEQQTDGLTSAFKAFRSFLLWTAAASAFAIITNVGRLL